MKTLPSKVVFEKEDLEKLNAEFQELENKLKEKEVIFEMYSKILNLLGSHPEIELSIPKTGGVEKMFVENNPIQKTTKITFI